MQITIVRAAVSVLLLWLVSFGSVAAPNVAFYYGANPPWDELQAFDIVVVEPGHGVDVARRSTARSKLFAYTSVGEISPDRAYGKDLPPALAAGTNTAWGTVVVDQTQPAWPRFFVDRVIAPLWNAGYRGFFLDNLDSFHLIAKTDEERAKQQQGLVSVIRAIRARFPDARLIFNRGFEVLPEVYDHAYAVAVESLYRSWNPQKSEYGEVSEADRTWIFGQLARVRDEYKLPVIAIDYVPPAQRHTARETARRIAQLGFIPWVSNAELDQLGIGTIEVAPRKILVLYESDGTTQPGAHARAALALSPLGYDVEYVDVRQGLPQFALAGRYAGIVTWFRDNPSARVPALRDWLARQRAQGLRIAMFGALPFLTSDAVAREFALTGSTIVRAPVHLSIDRRDPVIGYEQQPLPDRASFTRLNAAQAQVLLRIRSDTGDTMDAAAITTWGGYVLSPYDVAAPAGGRWVVQPVEFLRRALSLAPLQVSHAR